MDRFPADQVSRFTDLTSEIKPSRSCASVGVSLKYKESLDTICPKANVLASDIIKRMKEVAVRYCYAFRRAMELLIDSSGWNTPNGLSFLHLVNADIPDPS